MREQRCWMKLQNKEVTSHIRQQRPASPGTTSQGPKIIVFVTNNFFKSSLEAFPGEKLQFAHRFMRHGFIPGIIPTASNFGL